jgi:transcription elongation GreA/GreB family factor
MHFPDKRRVMERLIERMTASQSAAAEFAEGVRRDATHEEAKPENDKDTRALEQTYLARGQAMRAEALAEEISLLRSLDLGQKAKAVVAGALIALTDDDGTRCLFYAPHGGGNEFEVDGVQVTVVTPVSALGRALLGREVGDEIELRVRGQQRFYEIEAVA